MDRVDIDVACLGILVADFFSSPLPRLPEPGELMVVDEIAQFTGGCAANTAVALSKLGVRAGVLGKVGQDPPGTFIIDDLAGRNIDTSQIRRSAAVGTSKTLIIPTVSEDRRYIHKIGANADFGLEDIDFEYLSRARVVYVGGYFAMSGFTQESLIAVLKFAREAGITTVLDIVSPGTGDWLEKIRDALAYVDAFMPNDDEAETLTGEEDPARQAEALLEYGPRMVVVTMGGRGSLLMTNDVTIKAPPYKVDFKDASGAGDAFDAGFITGLLNEWSLEDTLKFAGAMGASCVRELGCSAGLFGMEEAKAFVSNNAIELKAERRNRDA